MGPKIFKRIATVGALLNILVFSMFAAASCGTSPSQPGVTISPASIDVKADDTVTFDVMINAAVPSRGAQCSLIFDPAIMTCSGVTEGDFYSDWAAANGGATVLFPEPVIENKKGSVSNVGVAVVGGGEGGARGKGILLSYHFKAVAEGTAAPTLSHVVVSDASGNTLEVQNQAE